jgi:DNA-binding CsgD family transcriptional regulator/tetratricopeptide (TPR) repeat protein
LDGHFVGRQAELALLRAKLDEARSGHPGIVLIEGPPGIGKTALVDKLAQESVGVHVLRASGEESESLLTYGVVDQLVRLARLDESTASAAERLQASVAEDHITIGTLLLDLLGGLQEQAPVVVVVDDLHWADPPSLRALLFGLRRLVADRVLALMVVRDEQEPALPEGLRRLVRDHGATLRLAGLNADDLRELSEAMGLETVSSRAAQRLHTLTEGNPLHARALLEELPADTWRSDELPLPSPRSFSLLVLYRCAACSPETQRLVEAASVLGLHCALATAARLAGVEQPLQALEEASKAGLLQPRDALPGRWAVAFSHPLVQAAVYHDLAPSRRAALHTAAAELADDEAVSLRHRVAAAPTMDAQLAQDLERFARREAVSGAAMTAAAGLVTASRLSPTPAERERRLLEAVSSMLLAGDRRQAAAFAEEIAGFPRGPLRDKVLGYLAYINDRPDEAERWLRSAWDQCDPTTDPPLAAAIALTNLLHWKNRLYGQEAVEWGRRAVTLASPVGDPVRVVGEGMLATALAYAGRMPDGLAVVESAITRVAATPGEFAMTLKTMRGWLRLVEDDLPGAHADLTDDASARRRGGISDAVPLLYSWLAWVEYCIGAWDDAMVHAERAHAIAVELEHPTLGWLVPFAAVPVPAARGDWAAAEQYASLTTPHSSGYEQTIVAAGIARAMLATARAHYDDVLTALDPLLTMSHRQAVYEPGCWPWQDLYGDALVHLGRLEEASAFLSPHESLADQRGRHAPIARLARVRGRLEAARGDFQAAEAAFQRGLRHLQPLAIPFERALLELAYGQFLRRSGKRRAAAAQLGSAQGHFISLGARPWLERCDRELMACGLAPAKRRGRDQERLTPQELCVARLAASGLSNREVATELMLSVKTVEFHLSHAYSKLAVRSRKELASCLQ